MVRLLLKPLIIHLVIGEENNIKITSPLDLVLAEELLDPPQRNL